VSDPLVDDLTTLATQLASSAPALAGIANALALPELGTALTLGALIVKLGTDLVTALEGEAAGRSVTPAQAKAAIDASVQAAITAKFGPA
jgi:hypothetical protein